MKKIMPLANFAPCGIFAVQATQIRGGVGIDTASVCAESTAPNPECGWTDSRITTTYDNGNREEKVVIQAIP